MPIAFSRPSLAAPPFTWATKPTTYPTGQPIWISDAGVKGSQWIFDGTRWKPLNNQCLLASLDTAVTGLTNSEVISLQWQTPAGFLQTGDRIRWISTISKSGTTDAGRLRLRIGTAGTTADSGIFDAGFLAAAAVYGGSIFDARIDSATTCLPLSRTDLGYGGGTTNAIPGAVTISNISNQLFISVSAVSSSTNNTVGLVDSQLWLLAKAN